jgi:hypothetical protein
VSADRPFADLTLTPAQADGLACVVCGADYLTAKVAHRPVGRSHTGSQVFACTETCLDAFEGLPTAAAGDASTMTTIMERSRSDDHTDQVLSQMAIEATQDRPYWQTEPCPPWCWREHKDSDPPPDRTHFSEWDGEVVMSLVDWTDDVLNPGGRTPKYLGPPILQLHLAQGWRESEPHVVVGPEIGHRRWNVALAEAHHLAEVLVKAADLGDGRIPVPSGSAVSRKARRSKPPRPFWLTAPCPSWCTSDHDCEGSVDDRVHFGDWYVDVPLTLIDVPFEEQGDDIHGQQPQTARVHMEQHVGEIEAHVWLGRGGSREGWNLTLAEARQVAADLTTAIALARSDD